jgi:hypothetical protein
MRSARWLPHLFALLAAAGCTVDEPAAPPPDASALKLSVVGNPRYLTGKVMVLFEAPKGSVSRVELDLRGEKVDIDEAEPFAFELDSSAFADGAAQLTAQAVLAGSGKSASASLDVELANAAPKLTVVSPAEGSTVIGSPSRGFTIYPVVTAADGNSVTSVWADSAKGPVDLGKADGSIPLLLEGVGTDFPHAKVLVTLHARDTSGAESATTVSVIPSTVKVRFEQPTGDTAAPASSLSVLNDGRPLIGFAGSYYLLPEPSLTAKPNLVLNRVDALTRSGDRLFFTTHDQEMVTESLRLANVMTGETTTLFDIPIASQVTAFDPFLHSSGRVYASWVDTNTLESHVLGYAADGKLAFETVHQGSRLLDQVAETPDGRLMTLAEPDTAVSFVQPFDATTGAELPAWAPPGGQFVLVDGQGVVVVYYTSKTYGTPAIHVASFDLTGTLQWDEIVDETFPQLVRRLPNGDVLTYLFGAGAGVPSSLTVLGKSGQTPLWTGTLQETDYLIGEAPGSSDLLVSRYNTTTSTLTEIRLTASGAIAWSAPLPGDANATIQLLSDGSVLASAANVGAKTITNALVGSDGKPAWTATFPGQKVLGAIEAEDLLLFAAGGGDMAPFRFEARKRTTGELSWRHLEGPSPDVFGRWVMARSKPWDVVLSSMVRAKKEGTSLSYTTVTLGFVP